MLCRYLLTMNRLTQWIMWFNIFYVVVMIVFGVYGQVTRHEEYVLISLGALSPYLLSGIVAVIEENFD